jgi:hypothetical protein
MARFLSAEWIGELAAAAQSDAGLRAAAEGVTLTVQQIVNGGSDATAAWYVRFSSGEVDIVPGTAHEPDVVIREDLATATRISRGELSPSDAVASGSMKIGGRIGSLVRYQAVLSQLRRTLATVHDETTYPDA